MTNHTKNKQLFRKGPSLTKRLFPGILATAFLVAVTGTEVRAAPEQGVIALTFDDPSPVEGTAGNIAEEMANPTVRENFIEVVEDAAKHGPYGIRMLETETVGVQSLGEFEWSEAFAKETDKLTVATWIYIPADAPEENIRIASRLGASDGSGVWHFTLVQSNMPYFSLLAHPNPEATTGEPEGFTANTARDFYFPRDQWVHVAMTFDQGEVTLYVDGEAVLMAPLGHNVIPAANHEEPQRVQLQFLSLPAGAMADDFFLMQGTALDGMELRSLKDSGAKSFLQER